MNYSSFLLRHWLVRDSKPGDKTQVFDIEHIQTGRRTRVSSMDQAQAWLESVSAESRLLEQGETQAPGPRATAKNSRSGK